MHKILFSWIGKSEIFSSNDDSGIVRAVKDKNIDEVCLLGNIDNTRSSKDPDGNEIYPYTQKYYKKFEERIKKLKCKTSLHLCELSSPTNYNDIYKKALQAIKKTELVHKKSTKLFYHLSAGTAPMITMWTIIAKTQFKGELLETRFPEHILKKDSKSLHVKTVEIPFDITAEYLPEIISKTDQKISEAFIKPKAFSRVLGKSPKMREIIRKANLIASRGVTVLLEGESGTGKELFAQAIHEASQVNQKNFVAVNCGAIPENLIESELFGYEKGAFTGANSSKSGLFEQANGGTIFLDEIGEIDKAMQVKLLRVLETREVRRVGGKKNIKLDLRVIAATNKDLFIEAEKGHFREDLYYRLAVAILHIPALRERGGDVGILVEEFLKQQSENLGITNRKLTTKAKELLLDHSWPGNVRELINVITSALVWSQKNKIDQHEIARLLRKPNKTKSKDLFDRNFSDSPNFLEEITDEVSRFYILKALEKTNNNLSKSAKLLGLKNYQTLAYKIKKLGIKN